MDGSKRSFFRKQSSTQFKRKGGPRKEVWNNSGREQPLKGSGSSETVYRILCHSRKIGSVIGKGGSIVKTLREETQAKITVADSVSGSDERVIIISSLSDKIPGNHNVESNDEEMAMEGMDELMEPHCAAQFALMKVHDRIIEEDIVGGSDTEAGNGNVVTARLLVPNNMVGCLLGKKGDVIQRLRSETTANIRVLPADHLPICAMDTDELVQISGNPAVARKALYVVSTLLHQNPRKDQPPAGFPVPPGNSGFRTTRHLTGKIPSHGSPIMSERSASFHRDPPIHWMGGYEGEHSRFGPGGFDDIPGGYGEEVPTDFSMKILCSAAKIGGVIGKGGFNVKQVQMETGASIHVEDVSAESDERVIRVSSTEAPWNPRSQTIDAILLLQDRTSELSDKGTTITRLLVPSSKVGCILGQGGHVINEMRRRTQADIRVYSKEDKPKCAAEDEELVQISGNFAVAKDALAEISSRLRARCLRDAKVSGEPAPIRPNTGYGHPGKLHGVPPPGYNSREFDSPGAYNHFKGRAREYEPSSYPIYPSATSYPDVGRGMELKMSNNAMGPVMHTGRSNISNIAGARVKHQDIMSTSSESFIDRRSHHFNNVETMHHSFIASGGPSNNPQQGSYRDLNVHGQNYNPQHGSFSDFNDRDQYNPRAQHGSYSDFGAHDQYKDPLHVSRSQHGSYSDFGAQDQYKNPQPASYHDLNSQPPTYPINNASQNPYHNVTQQQATYQNYQSVSTPQAPYHNISAPNSYQY